MLVCGVQIILILVPCLELAWFMEEFFRHVGRVGVLSQDVNDPVCRKAQIAALCGVYFKLHLCQQRSIDLAVAGSSVDCMSPVYFSQCIFHVLYTCGVVHVLGWSGRLICIVISEISFFSSSLQNKQSMH